ncbi:hypothetical protein LXL04_004384 [Taraxacum kok-saghyz]
MSSSPFNLADFTGHNLLESKAKVKCRLQLGLNSLTNGVVRGLPTGSPLDLSPLKSCFRIFRGFETPSVVFAAFDKLVALELEACENIGLDVYECKDRVLVIRKLYNPWVKKSKLNKHNIMLRPQIHRSHSVNLPLVGTPLIIGHSTYSPAILRQPLLEKKRYITGITHSFSNIKAAYSNSVGKSPTVKGVITIQPTISGSLTNVTLGLLKNVVDGVKDHLGRSFLLELVAANLDSSGKEKDTVQAHASYTGLDDENKLYKYECEFEVPQEFGEIGAILVQNKYHKEVYLKNIVLDDAKHTTFTCESWIQSKYDNSDKRIFFTNKIARFPLVQTKTNNRIKLRKTNQRVCERDDFSCTRKVTKFVDKNQPPKLPKRSYKNGSKNGYKPNKRCEKQGKTPQKDAKINPEFRRNKVSKTGKRLD